MSASTASMIRQLLKKDRVLLIVLLVAGLISSFSLYANYRFEWLWIGTTYDFEESTFVLFFVLGTSLGLLLTLRDEATRTQEFLWHRPVSRNQIFAARMTGAAVLLVSWLLLPWAAYWLVLGWLNPNTAIADTSRLGYYLAIGTVGFTSFAAACFAASWRGHWTMRITVGATPSVLLLVGGFAERMPGLHLESTATSTFLLVQALATAVLIFASWRNEHSRFDPDRPTAGEPTWIAGSIATAAVAILISLCASKIQNEAHWPGLYPRIAEDKDGHCYLQGYDPELLPDRWVLVRFDANHRPAGPAPERNRAIDEWSPHQAREPYLKRLWRREKPHPRLERLADVGRTQLYLQQPSGMALLVRLALGHRRSGPPSVQKIGKGTDHRPFGARARGVAMLERRVLVQDGDGFWCFDLDKPDAGFVSVPLPNGDKAVRIERTDPSDSLRKLLKGLDPYDRVSVVQGEQGNYVWDGRQFVRSQDEVVTKALHRPADLQVEVADPDLFTFTAVVKDKEGKETFRHRYTPRTWREQGYATLVFLGNVIRLPVLDLLSFLHGEPIPTFHGSLMTNPLFTGHRRLWFLLLCLLFAGGLSFLTARRLRDLQVPRTRRRLWTTAVALGGLPFFLFCRFHETNRAWRKPNLLAPDDAPKMWIQPLATSRSA